MGTTRFTLKVKLSFFGFQYTVYEQKLIFKDRKFMENIYNKIKYEYYLFQLKHDIIFELFFK